MTTLQIIWFLLIGVLLAGYAILDGFDLGVGIWYLFSRKEADRPRLLSAIGPVWDANEVWLLTGGGAIFAAFPHVYATVFSGLYLALMLVLFALIFRAVSVEFRNKEASPLWRGAWDVAFSLGSMLPALLFGVAVGNILHGLPLDDSKNFAGTFFGLLNPYALMIGLVGFAMFAMHGAMFIVLKTDGELQERARGWGHFAWLAYLTLFVTATIVTFVTHSHLLRNFGNVPVLWMLPILVLVAILATGWLNRTGNALGAFLTSSVSIAGLMALVGATIFPNLVPALDNAAWSLTIENASSSPLTLKTMLIIALIGMPVVIFYTVWLYRTFAGKVTAEEHY